jgi:hypothetical protein
LTNQVRIGIIKSFAKAGDRVRVYLPNGKSLVVTANNDLSSTKVAIIGDRAFSEDVAQMQLSTTTRLFKSKSNYQDDPFDDPWAYLFEINDFAALNGQNGTQINYTDTSWTVDEAEGYLRQLGDGGGAYKTMPDINQFEFKRRNSTINVLTGIEQNMYGANVTQGYGFEADNTQSEQVLYRVKNTDGVAYPTGFFNLNDFWVESPMDNAAGSVAYQGEAIAEIDLLDPSRQYYIKQHIYDPTYSFPWVSNTVQAPSAYSGLVEYYWLYVNGNSLGSQSPAYYFTKGNNGVTVQQYSATVSIGFQSDPQGLAAQINNEQFLIQKLLDNGFTSIGWDQPTSPNISGILFTAAQIATGATFSPYTGTITGTFPTGEFHDPPNRFDYNLRGGLAQMYYDHDDLDRIDIYKAELFIVPKTGRTPGVKKIYFQVRSNPKVLLHEIPAFEPWDGYVSYLETGEIEVVIKCGKKFHSYPGNPNNNSIPNTGEFGKGLTRREWAQIRVYTLGNLGFIEDTKIYNNSQTDLNPSTTPDPIAINANNWQNPWLQNYEDKRSSRIKNRNIEQGKKYLYWSYFEENSTFESTAVTDLKSAYRHYYGEVSASYTKGLETTKILRGIILNVSVGTMTPKGFVYIDPNDLLDKNIELEDNPLYKRLFPNPNYSFLSSLVNNSMKSSRFTILRGGSYDSLGNFSPGSAIKTATTFPKLDLGVNIPKKITKQDWSSQDKTLRNFAIKAIAYLGS